ncbi:hypothetical protein BGZ60DRAFT_534322 [Tricladium varicosporioides]|nr:hypothetical protein BGZ60DRAFT_534322 [Hymenoscyphus varicosporioides]
MPILDGFGATRQIRAIEEKRKKSAMESMAQGTYWGLTEAVRVGIELFMTKPVALKEVGKIIDNWAANRESEEMDIDGNGGSG